MKVRAWRAQDLPRMVEIWNAIVEEGRAFPQEETLTVETGEAFFASQSYCGVAEDENAFVQGLYILHPNNVGRCAHICNASYAVDGKQRGKHIGEALVRDCMRMGALLGFRILQFNAVVKTNEPAMRLYEKLGFTQLGVIPGGFRQRDGAYVDIVPHYCKLEAPAVIRKANLQDMPDLMKLFANARRFMADNGNPDQWWGGYPPREMLEGDIALGQLYVCEEDGKLHAAFVLAMGDDPTYAVIEGAWKNNAPYGTLHRIASSGEKRGMVDVIVAWAFAQTGNLRGDTHEKNKPMQKAFERNGFERCGIIYVEDGTPRVAYQKTE